MRASRVVLVISAVLFVCNIWGYDLWAPDEPFFAEGAREMLIDGQWLVSHINGVLNTHKPPLFFWLIALFSAPFGAAAPLAGIQIRTYRNIIATIKQCPSGALSYSSGGEEHRDRDGEPAIFVAPKGPYVVSGGPELKDTARGEGASTEHFTMCRCGGSKNKPFCDGTHWYREFDEDEE